MADADPADVVVGAVTEREAAEAQAVLPRVEGGQQPGLFGDRHIAFQPCLEVVPLQRQRALDGGLGPGPQFGEASVEQIGEFLLLPQFLV